MSAHPAHSALRILQACRPASLAGLAIANRRSHVTRSGQFAGMRNEMVGMSFGAVNEHNPAALLSWLTRIQMQQQFAATHTRRAVFNIRHPSHTVRSAL